MEAEDGAEGDALAGAGLAEQRQYLARAEIEADRVDGADDAVPGRELDAEVADAQE